MRVRIEYGGHPCGDPFNRQRLGELELKDDAPGDIRVPVQPDHEACLAHRRVDTWTRCPEGWPFAHEGHHKVSRVRAERMKGQPGRLSRGMAIPVAMGVMNVASYLFPILAARLLGPRDYGAFAALMGLLLVITVASLALQATAARRIVATPGHVHQIERVILKVGVQASLGARAAVPGAVTRDQPGGAPRQSRHGGTRGLRGGPGHLDGGPGGDPPGRTSVVRARLDLHGGGRPAARHRHGGHRFLADRVRRTARRGHRLVRPCAGRLVRAPAVRASPASPEEHRVGRAVGETFHNSNALLAFFALSNVDILVARNVLDGHEAGLYAGGLILAKAVLFLPQFVVVLAFPSMGVAESRLRTLLLSLTAVGLIGGVVAIGVDVLPDSRSSSSGATSTPPSMGPCGRSPSSVASSPCSRSSSTACWHGRRGNR